MRVARSWSWRFRFCWKKLISTILTWIQLYNHRVSFTSLHPIQRPYYHFFNILCSHPYILIYYDPFQPISTHKNWTNHKIRSWTHFWEGWLKHIRVSSSYWSCTVYFLSLVCFLLHHTALKTIEIGDCLHY